MKLKPSDYIDEPWPTLHNFLCGIKGKDRQKVTSSLMKQPFKKKKFLGQTRCSADELHDQYNIWIAAKLLMTKGWKVTEEVKSEAQARKHRQEYIIE